MNDGVYGKYEIKDGILVGYGEVKIGFRDQFGTLIVYIDDDGNEGTVEVPFTKPYSGVYA